MNQELEKLYNILVEMLGESKNGFDERTMQYQFPCPRCIERNGQGEARKHNLEINIQRGVFQCWSCSSMDDEMHGSIVKLIRLYGNEKLLNEYKQVIRSIRESELYKLNFNENDFNIDTSIIEKEELKFPSSFKFFKKGEKYNYGAFKYLKDRGIDWDIIERYKIGFTEKEEDKDLKKYSYRVIIPSYNALGELNYWVGRDYLPKSDKFPSRAKYANPKAEKKEIIFNEDKIQWDADVTLVEGAFDHIVVPNSVPLLGKVLTPEFNLYWKLVSNCNASINVWLDSDALDSAITLYKLLNHGRMYGKINLIPTEKREDPSSIYQKYGKKGIISHLANSVKIDEVFLQ